MHITLKSFIITFKVCSLLNDFSLYWDISWTSTTFSDSRKLTRSIKFSIYFYNSIIRKSFYSYRFIWWITKVDSFYSNYSYRRKNSSFSFLEVSIKYWIWFSFSAIFSSLYSIISFSKPNWKLRFLIWASWISLVCFSVTFSSTIFSRGKSSKISNSSTKFYFILKCCFFFLLFVNDLFYF